MNKVRRKFVLYAMIAVFVMLTALLGVINGLNFTMAANDADMITERLAAGNGRFGGFDRPSPDEGGFIIPNGGGDQPDGIAGNPPGGRNDGFGGIGPMGPDSPETSASVRFFTFRFDKDGSAETVAMQISAITEDEARGIAEKLKNETVGWTMMTYRYRVYKSGGFTYVTVIDQGRELLPSYRILLISVIGEIVGLVLSFLFLGAVGKKLFKPLEESDAKQKRFIADAERELKIPLTVIGANVETLERRDGADDEKSSIRRQVRNMSGIIKKLSALAIFDGGDISNSACDLTAAVTAAADGIKPSLEERGVGFNVKAEDGIKINCDPGVLSRMLSEIAENTLAFSKTHASFTLGREGEHIVFTASNDADIAESGNVEQVFDRFTVLSNGRAKGGAGLGLAYVKDAVTTAGGRVNATVENGVFTLKIII